MCNPFSSFSPSFFSSFFFSLSQVAAAQAQLGAQLDFRYARGQVHFAENAVKGLVARLVTVKDAAVKSTIKRHHHHSPSIVCCV